MAIVIGNQPAPSSMGQAAYAAGRGQYMQALDERAFRERELAQRKDLAQMQIDANKDSQIRGAAVDYVGQSRTIGANRDTQLRGIAADEQTQLRGIGATRSNLEYSTTQQREEAGVQRDWDENRIKYQEGQTNERLVYSNEQDTARQNTSLYYQRLNTLTNAQTQMATQAAQIRASQQTELFRAYNAQVQGYQQFQYQDYLQQSRAQQQMGQMAYGSELDFDRWQQQAEMQQQMQRENEQYGYSQDQQRKMDQISTQRTALQDSLSSGQITQKMWQDGMDQLAAREAGIAQFKVQRQSPYPPNEQPGMVFTQSAIGPDGKPTGRPYMDGNGTPIPFTRDSKGEVRVLPGYRIPQAPQTQQPSMSDQINLMKAIASQRAEYAKLTTKDEKGNVTQMYPDWKIDQMISQDFTGYVPGGSMRDPASQFLPGVATPGGGGPMPSQMNMGGGSAAMIPQNSPANAIRINGAAQAANLPRGTRFIAPDGSVHIR